MAKILIVDDSETLRIELRELLESDKHHVIEAIGGSDGIQKAEESEGVQLIISDYIMPDLDGIAMIRRIKEFERYTKVPVIMLTTESSIKLKTIGKEVGIVVWIVKPIGHARLLSVIDKLLKRFADAKE